MITVTIPFNKKKNVGVNVGVQLNKTQEMIYSLIKDNPKITYIQLAKHINKSEETIRRNIKVLVNLQLIERVGSDKTGHWKIKQ